jgi:hypothetical protein
MMIHEREAVGNYKSTSKPHHDRIREIVGAGLKIVYDKLLINATENQALEKERILIEQYGRLWNDTGILLNKSPGGYNGGKTEKPVFQYDLDGNFIAEFPSSKVASEQIQGANRSYICQCCKKVRKSAGGFQWIYKNDNPPIKFTTLSYRKVDQYTLTGQFITTFDSLTKAAKSVGVDVRTISNSCTGNTQTSAGYIWCYNGEQPNVITDDKAHLKFRRVLQLTLTGDYVKEYNSIVEASVETGIGKSHISRVVSDRYPSAQTAGGYRWSYAN